MTHCMNLELSAFLKIANGSKTIELRLNDKKRQKINIGDRIEFRCSEINSVIFAEVIKLHKFLDFEQLYKALPLEKCGYSKNDLKSAHYTDMEKYYIKEQIKKYSRDFDGTLTDADCIKLIGIARNTYYKYKRELREELTRNMES